MRSVLLVSLKYLDNRGLKDTKDQKVYAFLGDGEMDEIEAKGDLTFAAREGLDNLIFVVSRNLQRLDGPVTGKRQNRPRIRRFICWLVGSDQSHVGSGWDKLFAKDTTGKLTQLRWKCLMVTI